MGKLQVLAKVIGLVSHRDKTDPRWSDLISASSQWVYVSPSKKWCLQLSAVVQHFRQSPGLPHFQLSWM